MRYINTFRHHSENPGESVHANIRQKRIALAQEMHPRIKIYLDTKYWLLLRDVRLGRSKDADAQRLLVQLENLVRDGRVLCPLSVDIYAEVHKQTVPETLRATLRLIDDLSLGVSITEMGERTGTEVLHFIREKSKGVQAVYTLDELAWTKACYVLGFVTPRIPNIEPRSEAAIQKAFADQLWVTTMEDMLDFAGPELRRKSEWFGDDIASEMNEGKTLHRHEYTSFKQLFLNELAGILNLHEPMFTEIMAHIVETDTGRKVSVSDDEQETSGRLVANLIYNAFRLNKIERELPTFRIISLLHAAMRWDSVRKFKPNDLPDIHHAAGAIAYCDWFFTEHALRDLVANQNLGISSLFKCKTVSSPRDALRATAGM